MIRPLPLVRVVLLALGDATVAEKLDTLANAFACVAVSAGLSEDEAIEGATAVYRSTQERAKEMEKAH